VFPEVGLERRFRGSRHCNPFPVSPILNVHDRFVSKNLQTSPWADFRMAGKDLTRQDGERPARYAAAGPCNAKDLAT
jgi:hypothetical protein